MISETFLQDQRFLKHRSLLLRSLTACLFLSEGIQTSHQKFKGVENGSASHDNVQVLDSLITKIQSHHDEIVQSESLHKSLESPVQGPDRSRLTLFVAGNYVKLSIELLKSVLEMSKTGSEDSSAKHLNEASKMLENSVKQVISEVSNQSLKHRDELFEKVVNVTEVR